jgi:hypothetical protein
MERFLIDSNIILDLLFGIECFGTDAGLLWDWLRENKDIELYLTDKDLQDILFYVDKACGEEEAVKKMQHLTNFFNICQINQDVLKKAYSYNNANFQASVRIACVEINNIDYLVTFQPSMYNFKSERVTSVKSLLLDRNILTITMSTKLEDSMSKDHGIEQTNNPSQLTIEDYIITHFKYKGDTKGHPQAEITFKNITNNEEFTVDEFGNGPVSAVYRAIEKGLKKISSNCDKLAKLYAIAKTQGVDSQVDIFKLVQLYASSEGQGVDADVEVFIKVLANNHLLKGEGIDTDLVKASVYAYVSALNKLLSSNFEDN